MPEDDAATEHPPPPELSREPHDGPDDDADDAVDHECHDPYQPL
ncbi:hypothetical protein BJ973_000413 [Actinoplanes tereljensis]|uniref:Uncharacterized protein n=1 Tax=Paractinoplanes tereljensis TaxID=571912 RepID=A0A919NSI9_9ACTN|nr:hypothetical protein [Actinoplanes tereljensis]GIF23231.1 hypothetical protein Ate02nite_59610 [Actinoplanes tereljensis]